MEINTVFNVVRECEACGWDHEDIELHKHGSMVEFTCPMTRKKVSARLDLVELVKSILGRG